MNTYPLVSIVILSFNRLKDLQETIEYCRTYSYPNLEFIVVDNASSDGSIDYIATLDDTFQSIILDSNLGSAEGHSVGMRVAQGEYVITMDDDAFVEDKAIFGMVKLFIEHKKLAVISFNCINYYTEYEEGVVKTSDKKYSFGDITNSYDLYTESSAGFRNAVLKEVGYHQEEFFYGGEDTELSMRILAHGYNIICAPHLISYHKITNTARDNSRLTKNSVRNVFWMIVQYMPKEVLLKHLMRYQWALAIAIVKKRRWIYCAAYLEAIGSIYKMWKRRDPLSLETFEKINFPYRMVFLW